MRFSQPTRMSEDAAGPAWARRTSGRRKKSGFGTFIGRLLGFLAFLLAVFGALTAVVSIKEGSVASGGAMVDGWIAEGVALVKESAGQGAAKVEATADEAGEKAGAVANHTGDALKAGADKTVEELKTK